MLSASPAAALAEATNYDADAMVSQADADQAAHDARTLDLLADSVLPPADYSAAGSPAESTATDNPDATHTPFELVFIDGAVADVDLLIADLQKANDADPDRVLEYIVLDTERDGIAQITAALIQYNGVDGTHLVSHGRAGEVQLGSTTLSMDTIDRYRTAVSAWQHSLSDEADILIYGCRVAESESGRELLRELSQLTDGDVSGSEDLTGHEDLQGDWDLEYSVGSVETETAFSAAFVSVWGSTLDITSNLVAHYEFEEGAGSLAADSTTNNNDGTLLDSPSWDTGIVGSGAINFSETLTALTHRTAPTSISAAISPFPSGSTVRKPRPGPLG